MRNILVLIYTLLIFASCNKEKKISNRIDGDSWNATSIVIENNTIEELPVLTFDECKIYKESCTATWQLDSFSANFAWQFREKGTVFEISNQSLIKHKIVSAVIQCMKLSGIYNVDESTKNTLKISSNSTIGYSSKTVEITLEKNK